MNKRKLCVSIRLLAAVCISLVLIIRQNPYLAYGENEPAETITEGEISDELKDTVFTLPVIYVNSYDIETLTGRNHVPKYDGDYTPESIDTLRDIYVLNSSSGKNRLTDRPTQTYLDVTTALRGKSSARYQPKKSLKIEFTTEDGGSADYKLCDLDAESDFVLYAPYIDRSLVRNYLAYTLEEQALDWAPECEFVEVFLDSDGTDLNYEDDYCGVYLLTEKIKRGSNRIDISEYTVASDSEKQFELGGGLIYAWDWYTETEDTRYTQEGHVYQLKYPNETKTDSETTECAYNEIDRYDYVLFSGTDEELAEYYDIREIARCMLIDEFLKNHEGFGGSTYFYRDVGEKIKVVQWDFDLGTGNITYESYAPDLENYEGFWTMDYWELAKAFMSHENFREEILKQWDILRADILSDENIESILDDAETQLDGAWQRNDEKYGDAFVTMPFSNWDNGSKNSQDERTYVRQFILNRARWLDENIYTYVGSYGKND